MTEILVMSQIKAEKLILDKNKSYVCISITDFLDGNYAYLPQEFKEILRLQFHDIDTNIMESLGNTYFGMDDSDAKEIVVFLERWYNKVDYLIIHCHAGISRSSGIASAIEKYYNGDDSKYFHNSIYRPNMRCYRLVLDNLNVSKI